MTRGGIPVIDVHLLNQAKIAMENFESNKNEQTYDEYIESLERLLEKIDSEILENEYCLILRDIAILCMQKFNNYADIHALNKMIDLFERAVGKEIIIPRNLLNYFGTALIDRGTYTSNLSDIEKGVEVLSRIISLSPKGSMEYFSILINLGLGYKCRYDFREELSDLEECINIYRDAFLMVSQDSEDLPLIFNNLGRALKDRYVKKRDPSDLEESIDLLRRAARHQKVNSLWLPDILNTLGSDLVERYILKRDFRDLEESMYVLRNSINMTPTKSLNLYRRFHSLGTSLKYMYDNTKNINCLNESIEMLSKSVELAPQGSPVLPSIQRNLENLLNIRYEILKDPLDLKEYKKVLSDASLSEIRWPNSTIWGRFKFSNIEDTQESNRQIL